MNYRALGDVSVCYSSGPRSWKEKNLAPFLVLAPESSGHLLGDSEAQSFYVFKLKMYEYKKMEMTF